MILLIFKKITFSSIAQIWSMIRKQLHFSIKPTYTGMCGNIAFYLSDYSLLWNWWLNDITYIKKITFSSIAQIWSMIRKQLHFSIKTTYTGKCGNISFYLSDYSLLWNRWLNDITDIKKNYIFINCTNMQLYRNPIYIFL